MPADLGDTLYGCKSVSKGAVMELLILLSLAGVGAAFMALKPEDDNDNADDEPADDDTQTDTGDDGTSFIAGTDKADKIVAKDDQTTRGFAGNDTLEGEDRAILYGGKGNDLLTLATKAVGYGGDGDDRLSLMDSATAYGGAGNDRLSLSNSADAAELYGDDGNDILTYSSTGSGGENPSLFGGNGDDALVSDYYGVDYQPMYYPDNANFDGGSGNDLMQVSAGGTALGGAGADTVIGFSGTTLTGGAGNDLFVARSYAFEAERPYIYDATTPAPFDLVYLDRETITVTDFTKGEDRLQIDFGGTNPTRVDLADDGTDTTVTAIFDNGADDPFTSTVRLLGVKGLTLGDIAFTDGAGAERNLTTGQFDFNAGTPASIA